MIKHKIRVGKEIICPVCKKKKAPWGRSISDYTYMSYCNYDTCEAYMKEPKPDTLFPGETND